MKKHTINIFVFSAICQYWKMTPSWKDLFILHVQYHCCWWLGALRRQVISSNGIDLILPNYPGFHTRELQELFQAGSDTLDTILVYFSLDITSLVPVSCIFTTQVFKGNVTGNMNPRFLTWNLVPFQDILFKTYRPHFAKIQNWTDDLFLSILSKLTFIKKIAHH